MKRIKVLMTIMALIVVALAMAFGVLSQTFMKSNISTSLMFDVIGVRVGISVEMTGAKNSANGNLTTSANLGSVDGNGTVTKNIYTYSSDTSLQTNIPVWDVGNIYFNCKEIIPIVFKVNVLNYTVGKKLDVSITEVDANGNPLATSVVNSTATRQENPAVAQEPILNGNEVTLNPSGGSVQATLSYTLRSLNQPALGVTPLKLKVEIKEAMINSIVTTQNVSTSSTTNLPYSYSVPVNGVQTPYLLTWYMDEACTTPAEYNYTPISNQTLYGKTSKYPLFVPTNFVEYIDASTTVDSPGVIYKKLNATDVAVWGVNAGSLTEYSFPALIQIVGINYCVTQINGFNKVIKNLELPQGVDSIGSGAFKNNGELLEVIFPQSLLKIEAEAFRACYKLTSVIFPTNLTKIGNYAFMGPRLTSLFIPKSVTIFEQNPFLTNNNLQITIEPGSRFVMEKNCLIDTINKELVLGINATEIPNNMGIEKINVYALYYCKTLITVNIPSTVKIIDTYAFQACYKLQSVIIPASVNKMGYLVFDSCSVLKNVTINSIIPPSSRQYNFDKCHADLKIYVPPNSVGTTSSTPKEEYYKSATNWTTYANKIVAIGS